MRSSITTRICWRPGPRLDLARYFQSRLQMPARLNALPTAMFLARRAIRRGLPEAIALTLFEIRAAR
jgi:hypothetical protein